jgi:hypothetical protein
MRYRLLAVFLAASVAAIGQTLNVEKLAAFIESSGRLIAEGKMTDREVANYLSKVKLSERLDDRAIEHMQGSTNMGPKTLQALQQLRDRTQTLAAAKPLIAEPEPTPIPPPSSAEQAAILDKVSKYALSYSKSLPDFICAQVTRRYAAPATGLDYGSARSREPWWSHLDTLQIQLSYFEQKEDYKLILVNNRLATQDYRTLGGATSTGDFGTLMRQVFEPASEARFEWYDWATLRGRLTMKFAYRVSQAKSQWHINYDRKMDIVPAYRGLVYVDNETHEVTRITLQADSIPPGFPVRRAETILDYGTAEISGISFLLPLKAETIMAADDYLTKNETEFRNYRKYSATADLRFDTEIPPLPPEETKETAPPKVIKK